MEKAEVGRVREEKKKRQKKGDQTREKIQASEKLEKSRITMFFPHPEGRKVASLKRRVQSHLGKWEMTNCTPLWREADLEDKKF